MVQINGFFIYFKVGGLLGSFIFNIGLIFLNGLLCSGGGNLILINFFNKIKGRRLYSLSD